MQGTGFFCKDASVGSSPTFSTGINRSSANADCDSAGRRIWGSASQQAALPSNLPSNLRERTSLGSPCPQRVAALDRERPTVTQRSLSLPQPCRAGTSWTPRPYRISDGAPCLVSFPGPHVVAADPYSAKRDLFGHPSESWSYGVRVTTSACRAEKAGSSPARTA